MNVDVAAALGPVVDALTELGVRYRVGGSVASSALGVARTTMDVDLSCELERGHVDRFVAKLAASYYADADMIRDAITRRSSFNLVHLASIIKVDVFIRRERPFEAASFERVVQKALDEAPGARTFDLHTPEDVILHKLEWYRTGGEVSERQWRDVLGVMSVQASALDLAYLRQWAGDLGVLDLLERALVAAKEP